MAPDGGENRHGGPGPRACRMGGHGRGTAPTGGPTARHGTHSMLPHGRPLRQKLPGIHAERMVGEVENMDRRITIRRDGTQEREHEAGQPQAVPLPTRVAKGTRMGWEHQPGSPLTQRGRGGRLVQGMQITRSRAAQSTATQKTAGGAHGETRHRAGRLVCKTAVPEQSGGERGHRQ